MNTSPKAQVSALLEAVNDRDAGALERLLHPDYIQHNPNIPTGRAAFLGLLPVLAQHGTRVENVRLLEDGEHVVAHNVWRDAGPFGAPEMVSFDVLRIDPDGLIAEHWDAMMPLGPPNASGRSPIDGPTTVEGGERTEENRRKAVALFERLTRATPGDVASALPDYFQPSYAQHDPDLSDGIDGFAAAVRDGRRQVTYAAQHRVLAEGSFVLSISEGTRRGQPAAIYDLMRFADGKIAEHWGVIQDIPAEAANDNTMFGFRD